MNLDNGQLNSVNAAALCTVITLGFISLDRNRLNFLFEEDPADRRVVRKSYSEHDRFRELMLYLRLDNFIPVFSEQPGKTLHPFIYAKRANAGALPDNIDATISGAVDALEQLCNHWVGANNTADHPAEETRLYGAYIGGVAEAGQVRLLYPSLTRRYPVPAYVNINNISYRNSVVSHYFDYCGVSLSILNFFDQVKFFQSRNMHIWNIPNADNVTLWTADEDIAAIRADMALGLGDDDLFGSVHGLVTSMTQVPPGTLSPGNYNVELALSGNTTKVASCIPCSIFAVSQGAPPSYTHLGRGDFWNLPEDCAPNIRDSWAVYVNKCFMAGLNIVRRFLPAVMEFEDFFARLESHNDPHDVYVPDVFLAALTFEGSFTSKMIETLRILKAAN